MAKLDALTKKSPDRTGGIAGGIAPRHAKKPQPTEPDLDDSQAPQDHEQPEPVVSPELVPVADPQDVTKPVVFWVRPEVKTWVKATASTQHRSNAEVIQHAIECTYEALAAKTPAKTEVGRHLFAKAPKSAPRRRDGQARAQLFARVLQPNLEVIDALVDELSLGNRSVLVEEAVLMMINKEN